jgi:hypothetical protein
MYAARNASGHRVADQQRAVAAACIVDAVYQRLRKADLDHHRSIVHHKHIDAIEAEEGTGGPSKRPRIDGPAAAATAAAAKPAAKQQQFEGGELPVEEVIGRFLDGNDGLGPLNTQVRRVAADTRRIVVSCSD